MGNAALTHAQASRDDKARVLSATGCYSHPEPLGRPCRRARLFFFAQRQRPRRIHEPRCNWLGSVLKDSSQTLAPQDQVIRFPLTVVRAKPSAADAGPHRNG